MLILMASLLDPRMEGGVGLMLFCNHLEVDVILKIEAAR
jgi:hypothetical protein